MNVVLSYGLGVDSTALLLRWLTEPESRDFDLSDLLVVTSMTGDEWPRTGQLVEEHVLPRLATVGVRYAQVARVGSKEAAGIRVLDDTTAPRRAHLSGAYKLSDELTKAGTVPQAAGNRLCSMKFKGWVIDRYLALYAPEATRHAFGYELGEQGRADQCERHMPGRLAFGFEAGEKGRAKRASQYDTVHRVAEFPLIEWGWDRDACLRYIERVTGVLDWPKSACTYCPFSLTSRAGRERSLERYDTRPAAAIFALTIERRSLSLNPRGGLIAGARLADLIRDRRPELHHLFEAQLDEIEHAVYEVRRIWRPMAADRARVANANRDLRVLRTGSRAACESFVRSLGAVECGEDGIERVFTLRRGSELPAREHFVVAGPAGARDKRLASFGRWWAEVEHRQLELMA